MGKETMCNNSNRNNGSSRIGTSLVLWVYLVLLLMIILSNHLGIAAENSSSSSNSSKPAGIPALFPVNVGVVLETETLEGKMGLSFINTALSDLYADNPHYKTRLVLHVRDSMNDVVSVAAAVLDLIKKEQVIAIIGPETTSEAEFAIALGEKARVPIISYSATSPFLFAIGSPYFIQATQNDALQVQAITAIIQTFGWRQAVPVYVNNEFGGGLIPYLEDALQQIGTSMPYRSVISSSATDDQIVAELYRLMTMQVRVFIVHMNESLASRLFVKAMQQGMMSEEYVWIITNGIANALNTQDPYVIQSMQGVLGVRTYVPRAKKLENFTIRWKTKFQHDNPMVLNPQLNVYGLWAYDAALALARAVEHVGITNFTFGKVNNPANLSNDLSTFGVSEVGPLLLQAIQGTKFKGLSGNFDLVDGKLQAFTFQLINIVGSGEKVIGFWTPNKGLVRNLGAIPSSTAKYSTSNTSIGAIIWPGDSTSIPKGWVIPTNGKKLRIGVPVKDGFSEFVKVTRNPSTNSTKITGYCIDVFDAVMAKLPYFVPYEYVPFAKPDGQSVGTYDELIYQVYVQDFDAVVGDTTIIANRSNYVDFTLPYTESGVTLITQIKNNNNKKAWLFLRPLSWKLWLTTFCFFTFIAFVIWVLEHRINNQFRGPPENQAGVSLFYSFSTMVFAHSQHVFSNGSRFVVIVWMFVVLILTQSYTASLASLLTVQQLQPEISNVKELIKSKQFVGYQRDSFVFDLLKQMKFDEQRLKPYGSAEELDGLLSKGSMNGGVAVAFDEIPYLRIFLATHCSKYAMVPPTYKTDGFGFVFPKDSSLVSDVSQAILSVTEGDKMIEIEKAWFGNQNGCLDSSTSISSTSLDLESFSGLFMIIGVVATTTFIIFVVCFLHEQRHVWLDLTSHASIWERIRNVIRIFYQRDLNSHTFRDVELHGTSSISNSPNTKCPPSPSSYFVGNSPNTHYPPSPYSISDNAQGALNDYREQPTSLLEHANPNSNGQANREIVIEMPHLHQQEARPPEIDIDRYEH